MSDLISRQSALDAIQKRADIINSVYSAFWEGLIIAYSLVQETPSAEPERKKGEWEVQPSTGDDRPFIWWKCSECGHVIYSETERDRREFHAFCGRCGAEMTR